METFTVEGQVREGRGKGPARRTRLTGMVPAILYGGKKKESISLSVNAKQVARILRSETGHNTIFTVQVADGAAEKAMVKDWQVDPVSGKLLHVDLFRIAIDVSEMLIGKQLRAADLPFDRDKIKLLTDPVRVLAHVVILKKEEEPTPEAAVAAETAAAEPEVIKKGKKEEEGEGEAAAEAPAKAEKGEKKGKEK